MSLTLKQLKQFSASTNEKQRFNQLCRKLGQTNQWVSRQMISHVLQGGANVKSSTKSISSSTYPL